MSKMISPIPLGFYIFYIKAKIIKKNVFFFYTWKSPNQFNYHQLVEISFDHKVYFHNFQIIIVSINKILIFQQRPLRGRVATQYRQKARLAVRHANASRDAEPSPRVFKHQNNVTTSFQKQLFIQLIKFYQLINN